MSSSSAGILDIVSSVALDAVSANMAVPGLVKDYTVKLAYSGLTPICYLTYM